jgi:hypothetical protein
MKYIALAVFVGVVVYRLKKNYVCKLSLQKRYKYPDMRVKAADVDINNPWPYVLCENGDRVYLYT